MGSGGADNQLCRCALWLHADVNLPQWRAQLGRVGGRRGKGVLVILGAVVE